MIHLRLGVLIYIISVNMFIVMQFLTVYFSSAGLIKKKPYDGVASRVFILELGMATNRLLFLLTLGVDL